MSAAAGSGDLVAWGTLLCVGVVFAGASSYWVPIPNGAGADGAVFFCFYPCRRPVVLVVRCSGLAVVCSLVGYCGTGLG